MRALLILSILFSLISCGGPETKNEMSLGDNNTKYSKEINALLDENEAIQLELDEGNILQASNANQINRFRNFIVRSRRFLVLLLDDPNNIVAFKSLIEEVKKAEKLAIVDRDRSYIVPYINDLKDLIRPLRRDLNVDPEPLMIKFSFNESTMEQLIVEKDNTAADFRPRSNSHGPYLGASAFNPDPTKRKNGKSTIITPVMEIDDNDYTLSFAYLSRFYDNNARAERLIKFYVGLDNGDINQIVWQDLEIELGPDAAEFSDPPSYTTPIELPELKNKNIRFKIEYNSSIEKGFFPSFNIFDVTFREIM